MVSNKIEIINLSTIETKINNFAKDISEGLSNTKKSIPSLYFYDKKGSQIFEKICDLQEYYQTRTEADIIRSISREIANNSLKRTDIIELGSGSSIKTRILLEAFITQYGYVDYYPIDISGKFLLNSSQILHELYPALNIHPIAGRYNEGLEYISNNNQDSSKLVLWLGSSIGNLTKKESIKFLKNLSRLFVNDDRILIGMDLKKDESTLIDAYNDKAGVTSEFNLNLLTRINNELGGEFDLNTFSHRAIYNKIEGRIEMHLVSKLSQNVYIEALDKSFHFDKDEYIHTENSYKYNLKDIEEISEKSGFNLSNHWVDKDKLFSLNEFKIK